MPPPMLVDQDGASESSSISSPPLSPPQTNIDEIAVARRLPQNVYSASAEGVVGSPASATSAHNPSARSTTNPPLPSDPSTAAPPKARRQRKPREPKDAKPAGDEKPKEKKPRKPRVKKEGEPTAAAAAATTAAPRKRQKTEDKPSTALTASDASNQNVGPRQSTLTEMVSHFHHSTPAASAPPPSTSHSMNPPPSQPLYPNSTVQPPPPPPPPPPRTPVDNFIRSSVPPPTSSNTPTPRPFSSGQNYDPIRGSTIESAPARPTQSQPPPPPPPAATITNGTHSVHASPSLNRASASPSITSLIDPPLARKASAPSTSLSTQIAMASPADKAPAPAPVVPSQQPSPTPPRAAPTYTAPAPLNSSFSQPAPAALDSSMDIDSDPRPVPQQPELKAPPKSTSSGPTPKPAPAKANSPPKASGKGLLSSSDLFGGPSSNQATERKGVDIDFSIPLNPAGGNTFNMAQEIAKRYGRDALNPRAAAHREQLRRVAAAHHRLELSSADDMSVDLGSELDGDSNVEMGGMDEEKSATGADGEKPRKRRKKVEEYDKEDDFIDDTELAWQEQAAVAKDGFFVYSGPLVPVGQNAQIETAARGGGRGRGRGRGNRAAAAAANGTSNHASVAEKAKDPNAPPAAGRGGRGRGRGTGAPRKPRITKADRERMEAEKVERERLANGQQPMLAASNGPLQVQPPSHAANAYTHGVPT